MLIEGLGSATMANGMMRIETIYRNAKGDDVTGPELIIPGGRFEAIIEGLQIINQRAKEAANQVPEGIEPN